jgi:hypothetical protein
MNTTPPTEQFMRSREGITKEEEEAGMEHWAKSYFTWNANNFETYKQAIYQGNGCVIAAWGNNYCWRNPILEVPDTISQCDWAHGVFCVGFFTISDTDDELVKKGMMTMDEARRRFGKI